MRTITSDAVDVFRGTFNVHFNVNSVAQISGLNATLATGCAHTILCTNVRCRADCNADHCKGGGRKINVNGHSTIYTVRIVGYLMCFVDRVHSYPQIVHRAVGGLGHLPGRNSIASNRYATNSWRNTDDVLHWIIQHELGHNIGAFDDSERPCSTGQPCAMRNIYGVNEFCRNCYNAIRTHLTARYVSFNYECEY